MIISLSQLRRIATRRRVLSDRFSLMQYEEIEETCIPAYSHKSAFLSYAAWWRLIVASRLAQKVGHSGPVLDFGSSCGELYHFLPTRFDYHFVEENEAVIPTLKDEIPEAEREHLETLSPSHFAVVFALDSLEHCDDRLGVLNHLHASLADDGALVVSGPTENAIYRLGRRLAGFGHYAHDVTIDDVERDVAQLFERTSRVVGPLFVPAFAVSMWRKRRSSTADTARRSGPPAGGKHDQG